MNPHATEAGLRRLATAIRLRAVAMVAPQGFGYLGQALSAAEQYAAVYGAAYRPGTDRVVCSPGHYVIAAYAAAAQTGLLDEAALASYGQNGSALEAIGTERSPVPEYTCGSLGQGLSAAAGFALADRLTGRGDARTFAFISDGELQEGQVWEAAMFAGHHRLSRLTVLLDANNSQVDGPVDSITTIEPIAAKWRAFGWDAADLDGHDVTAIAAALRAGTPTDQAQTDQAQTDQAQTDQAQTDQAQADQAQADQAQTDQAQTDQAQTDQAQTDQAQTDQAQADQAQADQAQTDQAQADRAQAGRAQAGRPQVLICRTSTRHGLACLPPDADGHFIKLPAGLAEAAAAELRAELDRLEAAGRG